MIRNIIVLVGLVAATAAFAQPASERSGETAPRERSEKAKACLEQGRGQNLRGPELRDFATICAAEARLACLKQAVAQKARGTARAPFIKECMSKR